MTANPSRSAFLTSNWTDFIKESYKSEERNEQEFRRKWESGEITGKLHVPFSVGRAQTPAPSDRKVPNVPSLPQDPYEEINSFPILQPVKSKPRPYYRGNEFFCDRSLRAEAVIDQSVIDGLKLRLSKANKEKLRTKFSQSKAVSACLDFRRPTTNASIARKNIISNIWSPRTNRLRQQSRQASRASSRPSTRASTSFASPANSKTPIKLTSATEKAFKMLKLRLDERVGLPLSLHQLHLRNAFKKAKITNVPGRLNYKQLERVLMSLGMGYNTYNDGGKELVAQFMDDECVRFMDLIDSYVIFSSRTNSKVSNSNNSIIK